MNHCTNCGKQLEPNQKFCPVCGTAVISEATSTTPNIGYNSQSVPSTGNTFLNSYLVFVILGAFFFAVIIMTIFADNLNYPMNLQNIVQQFGILAAIAFALVISTRAKGPDLSLGYVIGLSAVIIGSITVSQGSWALGLFVALIACGIIGLINGVLTTFLRIPSIIVTLVTSMVAFGIALTICEGNTITGDFPMFAHSDVAPIILLIITFAIAFLFVFLSKLGTPLHQRNNTNNSSGTYVMAYVVSSLIAALVGFYMLSRFNAAVPNLGSDYLLNILFVFACIIASRAVDNKALPVIYVLAPVFIWTLFQNALVSCGASVYLQYLFLGIVTLGFVIVAYIARRDTLKNSLRQQY